MSFESEGLFEAGVVDALNEIHALKERAKYMTDEQLVKRILDVDVDVKFTEPTEIAIETFFNTGYLTKSHRNLIENCYVLMENDLCWGETEEDVGVFQTTIHRK